MNAVVALCHFCEIHGPTVVFCTQAVRGKQDIQTPLSCKTSSEHCNQGIQRSHSSENTQELSKEDSPTPASSAPCLAQSIKQELCQACRSLPESHPGLISTDPDSGRCFISNQQPRQPEVYSIVRQACLRSLSVEVCPGREGPMFFGDEQRGHVLCYTFMLSDPHGRGRTRRYAFLVVMRDKVYLLNSWCFLVKNFSDIVSNLKKQAEEQSTATSPVASSLPSLAPTLQRLQRANSAGQRSLQELLGDNKVYHKLHQAFTWLLKVGGARIRERLYEGPPTEDTVIDLEKQDETEDGFVLIYSKPVKSATDDGPVEVTPTSMKSLLQVLGSQRFRQVAYNVIIGNQVIIRCTNERKTKGILRSLETLLPRGCCRTTYYTDSYQEPVYCNLLGVPPRVSVPENVMQYLCVDIRLEDEQEHWTIQSPVTVPPKGPDVLDEVMTAVELPVDESVIRERLNCTREIWLNKVKVLFKFTRAGGERSPEDRQKLLHVVGCSAPQDDAVLKFWTTGLSVHYRNQVLT